MTEIRRQQVNAASHRYWLRKAVARAAQGLTSRGTPRIYQRWETPGLPRHVRARLARRYCPLAHLIERTAALLAKSQGWLPADLRNESVVLARQLAAVKRHNQKRRVRIA